MEQGAEHQNEVEHIKQLLRIAYRAVSTALTMGEDLLEAWELDRLGVAASNIDDALGWEHALQDEKDEEDGS